MEYQELKSGIRSHLNDAAEDFFMVGYFLRQISENALFTEDGYKSIWDFAKGEYGLSTSSASRFMAINARFSIDGGEHMAEKYIGMGVSKLQEMLGLPDEELEKVTQETTVREIRAMKKKQEELRKQQKEAEKRKADFVERSNGAQKNVRELIKQQEEKRQQEAEEKKAAQKLKEDSRLLKFYKDIYPGSRQIIAQRDKAAITKEFKALYGNTYETGKGWSCYPDKIVFRDGPEAEQIQITWGRFTTKLVDFLDRFPETEKSILFGDDSRQQEPEIIDADFKEVEPERQEPERNDEIQEQNDEAQERNDELQEDQEPEIIEDPESYTLADVKEQLRKHEADLKAYREVGDLPSPMMQKQKILVDALQLLVEKKEFDEKEAAGID